MVVTGQGSDPTNERIEAALMAVPGRL